MSENQGRVFLEEDVLQELCGRFGYFAAGKYTVKQFAKDHGISPGMVSDVLNGRRAVSERVANALGFDRQVRFIKLEFKP